MRIIVKTLSYRCAYLFFAQIVLFVSFSWFRVLP